MDDNHEPDPSAPDVEVFTRYSTTVETMSDAWAFVMARIDACGEDPSVQITPQWQCFVGEDDEHHTLRTFIVVVSGSVDEMAEADL